MPQQSKNPKKTKPPKNNISEERFQEARVEIKKILTEEGSQDKPISQDEIKVSIREEKSQDYYKPSHRAQTTAANKEFNELYQDNRNGRVNMSIIDKTDPNRKKKIIGWTIFALVIIVGFTLAGFYYFINRQDQFTGENISLNIDVPINVASGNGLTLTLEINNQEVLGIKNAEVTVQYPGGFTFSQADPQPVNEANNAWGIGTVKSRSTETINITGLVVGDIGSVKEFNFILSYMPENFNSEFQMKKSANVIIKESVIGLDMDVPVKVISEQASAYNISVTNNSPDDMNGIRIVLSIPEDMEISSKEPESTDGDLVWEIESLESGKSYDIKFNGSLSIDDGEMREISAEVGYVDNQGQYHVQAEESSIVFVVFPQLILSLSVNGDTSDTTTFFGKTLQYKIGYANESQSDIRNMELSVDMSGEVLDWNSLIDSNNGSVSEQTIIWDKNGLPDLELVEPGDQGEFWFSINLADNLKAQDSDDINYTVSAQVLARSSEVTDLEGSSLEVESEEIVTKINSRLDLRAEGRYYDDEYLPVGEGPIPPVVGEKTTYQIYWFLQNGTNEVANVEVKAELPEDVRWTDDTLLSAGEINYDPATRIVTWSINKIPPHVGQLIPELEVRFGVEVVPEKSDIGKLLILLNKSEATASDNYTEQPLTNIQDMITSDLPDDPIAADQGKVFNSAPANTNTASNTNN
ncbi:hypothetical protein KKF61_02080 [Patescibacteria group bacterium]|nr:hypothetical protein [Patescibacteria group bacterium]MBU0963700.1 hypothetical protein [Patescibacteria group bacterium]